MIAPVQCDYCHTPCMVDYPIETDVEWISVKIETLPKGTKPCETCHRGPEFSKESYWFDSEKCMMAYFIEGMSKAPRVRLVEGSK